jgi:chemotaxis response regulator CheB
LAAIGAAAILLPDLIVIAGKMPELDGIDAAGVIRSRIPVPVVFVADQDIRAEVAWRLVDPLGVEMLFRPSEV